MATAKTAWEQYRRAKAQYPHCIVWFRMGDFYETFGDDAAIVARVCGVALTSRYMGREAAADQREAGNPASPAPTATNGGEGASATGADTLNGAVRRRRYADEERVPLAGVPEHAADVYLARLVAAGYKVAICEQVSEPGRGLIERRVVRVITPGTVVEPDLLRQRENNYLAALCLTRDSADGSRVSAFGLAFVDVTTGEFRVTQVVSSSAADVLESELHRLRPAEVLVPEGTALPPAIPVDPANGGFSLVPLSASRFDEDTAQQTLCRQFQVRSLEGFGCARLPLAVRAAGAILAYVGETNPALLPLLADLKTYFTDEFMTLDVVTRRNLELIQPGRRFGAIQRPSRRGSSEATRPGTLLGVIDQTVTPMGGRLLRRYLGQPLRDLAEIRRRHDAVEALVDDVSLRSTVRGFLTAIGSTDVERITGRIAQRTASPRDLLVLRDALLVVRQLRVALDDHAHPALAAIAEAFDACDDVAGTIGRAVADEDGRLIRPGYRREVDELAARIDQALRDLADLERVERERSGIKSLKVGYHKVLGYYIEVTHPNRHLVPSEYTCRQTLTTCDRFVTPRLKDLESALLTAEARLAEVEREVFAELLGRIAGATPRLLATAGAIAQLDVLAGFAEVAVRHQYVRPVVDESDRLILTACRHPVVEATHGADRFIPNDCHLDADRQIVLLTGPNMAGKSTYLRQVALCVLLAQVGSFVPARAATIGIVDRIFTRVGAQDDIASGASTFMVEMVETAAILRHATDRSLIVLDEIGRGTSTRDGLAIARAIVEHIHDVLGTRALFATHYGELGALAESLPRLRNYRAEVAEDGDQVVFLYRVAPGSADRSYGVHVARLAGLPHPVVARAEALLQAAESDDTVLPVDLPMGGASPPTRLVAEARSAYREAADAAATTSETRSDPAWEDLARAVIDDLLAVDVAATTPLDALNRLFALQRRARDLRR